MLDDVVVMVEDEMGGGLVELEIRVVDVDDTVGVTRTVVITFTTPVSH